MRKTLSAMEQLLLRHLLVSAMEGFLLRRLLVSAVELLRHLLVSPIEQFLLRHLLVGAIEQFLGPFHQIHSLLGNGHLRRFHKRHQER